jgi:hypothetical protein
LFLVKDASMRLGHCLLPLLLVVGTTAQQFDTGSGEEVEYVDEGTGNGEDASDSEESSGEGSGEGGDTGSGEDGEVTEVTVLQSASFSMPAVGATTISLRLDQVQGKEDSLQLVCL